MAASQSLTVAVDGACQGNPGPAGWAWVDEHGNWRAGSVPAGTNNIAELLGLLNALRDHREVPRLTVAADSSYIIGTYTQWMDGWARNGWRTAAKKQVANQDIVRHLLRARDWRREAGLPPVTLVKVKGHSGHPLNEWADNRAVYAAAQAALRVTDTWSGGGLEIVGMPPADEADRPAKAASGSARRSGGWVTQTELGKPRGLTAVQVGTLMVEVGIRDRATRRPTAEALADGLAKEASMRDGTTFWLWSADKVTPLLFGGTQTTGS